MILDNRYDAATALKNAEEFVRSRIDLVIEFQVEQQVAPVIADRIAAAGIPLIAIDIPHPHAIFFGVDNYRVGYDAGQLLAQHAVDEWRGQVDWVLGLDIEEAGPLVQSRITGAFEGVRSKLEGIAGRIVRAHRWARDARQELPDGVGFFEAACEGKTHTAGCGDRHQRFGRAASGAGVEARQAGGDRGPGLHSRGGRGDAEAGQPDHRIGLP
jgi:hypothetical protein